MIFLSSCFKRHFGKWRTGNGRIFFPAFFIYLILLAVPLISFEMTGFKSVCEAQDKTAIYFYSSETNINNYKFLKIEFDNYLSLYGPFQFQPFNDRSAFENHIKNKQHCLLLTSSWHFKNIQKAYHLKPILAGVRKGKSFQKYLLITSASSGSSAIQEPVASAGTVPYTLSLLKEIFPSNSKIDGLRILTVPKDIDALMSVGFQMAKSALTTENTLSGLKKLDPVLYKRLNVTGESPPTMLLVVSAPATFKEGKKLTEILRGMPKNAAGVNLLKLLDLDGWKSITSADLK